MAPSAGTALAPPPESPLPAASVLSEHWRLCSYNGDECQDNVSVNVTNYFWIILRIPEPPHPALSPMGRGSLVIVSVQSCILINGGIKC